MLSFIVIALTGLGEGAISTLIAPYVAVVFGGGGRELGYLVFAQTIVNIIAGLLLVNIVGRIEPLRLIYLLAGIFILFVSRKVHLSIMIP